MSDRADQIWFSIMPPEVHAVTDKSRRLLLTACLVGAILLSMLATVAVGGLVFGCAPAKAIAGPACEVIHAADTACHLIAVTNAAGETVLIPVAAEDLRAVAARAAARHGVQLAPSSGPPGGSPAGVSFAPAPAPSSSSPRPTAPAPPGSK